MEVMFWYHTPIPPLEWHKGAFGTMVATSFSINSVKTKHKLLLTVLTFLRIENTRCAPSQLRSLHEAPTHSFQRPKPQKFQVNLSQNSPKKKRETN